MSKLKGKVALVTGASKGIGAAIAKSLAAEGASVVVNYASSKAGADATVADIVAAGGTAVAVRGDVSKAGDAQAIVDAAVKQFGRLDVLVNNSGVYGFAPIENITEEDFHKHFNINVLGLLLTTQAAVKHLGEGSSIINIGSVVTRITPPGSAVYTGTKGAVDAITGVLSRELGARKIRVNALRAWSKLKARTRPVSSAPILKPAPSHKRRWVASVSRTTSRRSPCSSPRTTLTG